MASPGPLPAVHYERHSGAASSPSGGDYQRREPEKTVLHAVVREHLASFLEEVRSRDGEGFPRFIEREFRRYLDCGLLARGFARLRCPACGHERLVSFSCKGRLCPSCTGRRMADIAAFLVDERLPEAPYRQWVLTFPWPLRFRLAVDRPLFSTLVRGYLHTLFAWQRRRGRALGMANGITGAVTFVQRFGGALNLHPHVHSLVPDGLFVPGEEGQLAFAALPPPTEEALAALTTRIARRLTDLLQRHAADDDRAVAVAEQTAAALREALATAVRLPRGSLALDDGEPPPPASPLCARVAGFTLHAAQAVGPQDRPGLERLCRYGLRAPFAQERLTRREDGRLVYTLRRPWPRAGGATRLVLQPHELLRRLAALTPAPYTHLVRYHGVFANRSRVRRQLPPPPPAEPGTEPPAREPEPRHRRRLPWAQLLRRVFFVDALRCPRCATPMTVLAFLTDPAVVTRVLAHLGLPAHPPPLAPARAGDRSTGFQEDVPYDHAFPPWTELDPQGDPDSCDPVRDPASPWDPDVADHPP